MDKLLKDIKIALPIIKEEIEKASKTFEQGYRHLEILMSPMVESLNNIQKQAEPLLKELMPGLMMLSKNKVNGESLYLASLYSPPHCCCKRDKAI